MNRDTVDRWCELGILGLVLALLVFGPLAFGAVRPQEFLVIEGLTLGVLGLWGIRLWVSRRPQLLWPPICWAVLAFVGYALVRYLGADIEYVGRQEFIQVLIYGFVFLAILNHLHRQETMQLISLTLIFLAMAISLYALYQFLADSDYVWYRLKPYHHRGSGTYISPNHLGGFLEMLLPLALAYTLTGRLKPVPRVLLGYAALVMLAGIGVTLSRGSWVATGLALLLLFGVLLFCRNYWLPALVLLVALVAAAGVFLPKSHFVQSRLKAVASEQGKYDSDIRLAIWGSALRMWQDHFWWGQGPAHFNPCYGVYRSELVQLSPDYAHNDYLNTLADYGLAGTTLVASAWVLLGLGVAKTWRIVRGASDVFGRKSGSNKFAFVLGATVGLAAILVHSFFDFNLHIPANAILTVALMALLSSHLRFATERYWVGLRVWAQALATAVLVAGLGYLGFQGWRQARECFWLERAAAAPAFSPEKVALLERAYAVEPLNPKTTYAIGEALRKQSLEGGPDTLTLAGKALDWFDRTRKLDPWDSQSVLRHGMCLDWVGRRTESAPDFDRADQLDPNSYFVSANIGCHYFNLRDYAAAKPWLERSLQLEGNDNLIARSYLDLANARLLEAATNELRAKLYAPGLK